MIAFGLRVGTVEALNSTTSKLPVLFRSGQVSPVSNIAGVWTFAMTEAERSDVTVLNAGWANLTILWSAVQPNSSSDANFLAYDQIMARASGNGSREVMALIRDNPSWAALANCRVVNSTERNRLATFVQTVVNRYKGAIPDGPLAGTWVGAKWWQIYNESSHQFSGTGSNCDSVAPTQVGIDRYALIVETVSPAMKAADSAAKFVMAADVSGNFYPDCPSCFFDRNFVAGVLAKLIQDNKLDLLDATTVNFFSSQAFDVQWNTFGVDLVGRINRMRLDMFAVHPTAVKPIIVAEGARTELCVNGPCPPPPVPSSMLLKPPTTANASNAAVAYALQRQYVTKALARASFLDLKAYFWFFLQDCASIGTGGCDFAYGLKASDGGEKPGFGTFKYSAPRVAAVRLSRLTDVETGHPFLEGYRAVAAGGCAAGQTLIVIWNEIDGSVFNYVVPGFVHTVNTGSGSGASFSGNVVPVGQEPLIICYS